MPFVRTEFVAVKNIMLLALLSAADAMKRSLSRDKLCYMQNALETVRQAIVAGGGPLPETRRPEALELNPNGTPKERMYILTVKVGTADTQQTDSLLKYSTLHKTLVSAWSMAQEMLDIRADMLNMQLPKRLRWVRIYRDVRTQEERWEASGMESGWARITEKYVNDAWRELIVPVQEIEKIKAEDIATPAIYDDPSPSTAKEPDAA